MSLVPRESGLAGKWPDSKLPQHFEKLAQQLHDSDYRFWLNAIETVCLTSQCRFIDSFGLYMDAVIQQAADRDQSHIRSIQSYFDVRRNTIGATPSFALLEMETGLPDEVFYDPSITKLTALCTDMLILGNDLCSYNIECVLSKYYGLSQLTTSILCDRQARGDGHNVITIAMHELNTDLDGALGWVSKYHDEMARQFFEAFRNLPSWGKPLDVQVSKYANGLGNWVRANDSWSFEVCLLVQHHSRFHSY